MAKFQLRRQQTAKFQRRQRQNSDDADSKIPTTLTAKFPTTAMAKFQQR
jgi:hypothetical protein